MKADDPFTARRFAVALAVVLTVITAVWALNPPRYLTNDDVAIRLGLEGRAVPGQPPTGFVLMTHAALGWAVAAMQPVMPALPLWDAVVAATFMWALAVLFTVTWNALGRGWLRHATAVLAMAVVAVPLIAGMQFTIASTLAGGAAVMLAFVELASARPRTSVLVMSALLLLAGLLVRPMGAVAGAVTTGLVLAPGAAWERSTRSTALVHVAGLMGIAALMFGLLLYLDGWLYRLDEEWDAYYRYNWMVAQLVEWGAELPQADVEAIRTSAGWSGNDWAMLQRWFNVDPALHGYAQVSTAYETRAALLGWNHWLDGLTDPPAIVNPGSIRRLIDVSLPLLAIVGALAGVHAGWRGAAATISGLALFSGLCFAIEATFKELPFRLLAPLQACVLAAVIATVGGLRRTSSPALAIVGLAVVLTALTQQAKVVGAMEGDRLHIAEVEQDVLALQRLSPSLVVIHADAFPSEYWWRPFVQPPVTLPAISLAGNNQSPLLQRFLSESGRQPLFRAICDDPSILVISEPGRLDLVTTYLREHFNAAVRWDEVFAGSFRAWRCVPGASVAPALDATTPARQRR